MCAVEQYLQHCCHTDVMSNMNFFVNWSDKNLEGPVQTKTSSNLNFKCLGLKVEISYCYIALLYSNL